MLPLGDDNSDRHRPPFVTIALIVANVAAFLYELSVQSRGDSALQAFVTGWGVVPLELSTGEDLSPLVPGPYWVTVFSSMFLHGGWGHLLGNMLFLWVFGDNVEDRLGRFGFLAFYLVAGVAGSLAQVWANPESTVPMVGASGAISGVLGAYVVKFPFKRVSVLLFVFIVPVPAILMIGLWGATQLMHGFGSLAARTAETGGVAYMAHVGGFVVGIIVGILWRILGPAPPPPPRRVVRIPWM